MFQIERIFSIAMNSMVKPIMAWKTSSSGAANTYGVKTICQSDEAEKLFGEVG